ncbi:MAG: exo-alpha-sialidase [Saprospiraceae bacterium]|nr:exo-alpha-sialidase [Saprospiraceae bacterium]
MFNKNLMYAAFFVMLCSAASAQVNPYLKEVINNRVKTDIQQFTQYVLEGQVYEIPKLKDEKYVAIESRENDLFVNATPEPESEFHAAINPKDTQNIIICSMRNNPNNFLAPLTFPIYYTKDFGATWELSQFDGTKAGEFILGGGDPILVFDTEGIAYLCWLTLTTDLTFNSKISLKYALSKDGGATWIPAATPLDEGNAGNLLDILGGNVGGGDIKFVDKEWLSVDRSNSPYRNTIYASYLTIEAKNEEVSTKITMRKKTANSTTFSDTSIVVHQNDYKLVQFTSIDVDNKGTVHLTFAGTPDSLNWAFYYVQSKDGGETFTPEIKITDFHLPRLSADEPIGNIIGIDEARIYPCPQLAIDKSSGIHEGTLYYVWTANGITQKEAAGLDIYFTRSRDGGSTWETPIVLNDDALAGSHQFYPSIALNEQGKIVVSWYDRREDVDNVNTSYYMTYSVDGGNSFVPNFAVSSESADFSVIGSKTAPLVSVNIPKL